MSLFSFVADVGMKLFSGKEDPAEAIKKTIEADNPGIGNLGVKFENSFVTLSGKADSVEAIEKAVLMAGNVHGVGRVVSDIELTDGSIASTGGAAGGGAASVGNTEFYTIRSGDTLSAIAKQFYGDPSKYTVLFEANRQVIKHPDKIFPGQVIRVPR